jgi:hypothetical protein
MRSSSSRLEWISHGLYLENAENTHSEGSHNEISKVDSEGEKEVFKDVVDGLVCDDRMWMTVAGRGSRNGLRCCWGGSGCVKQGWQGWQGWEFGTAYVNPEQ